MPNSERQITWERHRWQHLKSSRDRKQSLNQPLRPRRGGQSTQTGKGPGAQAPRSYWTVPRHFISLYKSGLTFIAQTIAKPLGDAFCVARRDRWTTTRGLTGRRGGDRHSGRNNAHPHKPRCRRLVCMTRLHSRRQFFVLAT